MSDPMNVKMIRSALDFLEANYASAMDAEEFGLASALHDKIMKLRDMLADEIAATDPDAGRDWGMEWYDTSMELA